MKRKLLINLMSGMAWTFVVVGVVMANRTSAPDHGPEAALGTAFTYQGQLSNDGGPVTAACDMAFRLYDQATDGNQEGDAITTTVPITDELFTARLDFGAAPFDGDALWLGILVNCPGDADWTDLGRARSLRRRRTQCTPWAPPGLASPTDHQGWMMGIMTRPIPLVRDWCSWVTSSAREERPIRT